MRAYRVEGDKAYYEHSADEVPEHPQDAGEES